MEAVENKKQKTYRIIIVILGAIIAVSLLLPFLSSLGGNAQIIAPSQNEVTNEINQKELS